MPERLNDCVTLADSTEGGDVMRVRKTDRKVASTLSLQKAN
jgi:hypothetical protein